MRYVMRENDDPARRYATHVRGSRSGQQLVWESSPGQDVLVVQTPYERDAVDDIQEIVAGMEGMALPVDCYVEVPVKPGTWVRYVPSTSYARNDGCPLRTKACTYTVFCCQVEGDTCVVYSQQMTNTGNLPYRRIRLEVDVQVRKLTRTVGPFWNRREEDTGYYQITLPKDRMNDVCDGDVYYTVAGAKDIEIPLTRAMFKQGYVYVQTFDMPVVATRNDGLQINQ